MSHDFHTITTGTNGACGALCTATAGYDYVTETPAVASLVNTLAE